MNTLAPSDVLARDRSLQGLRRLAAQNRGHMQAAYFGVLRECDAIVAELNEKKRAGVRTTLAMLEIAKRRVLNPKRANAHVGRPLEHECPPPGIDPVVARMIRRLRRWQYECYQALGTYEPHFEHEMQALTENLDVAARDGFDVQGRPAIDAHVYSLSKFWSRGKYPEEQFRAELDPNVINSAATRSIAIVRLIDRELSRDIAAIRTDAEWWRLVCLLLLMLDPRFDGTGVDSSTALPWTHDSASGVSLFEDRLCVEALLRSEHDDVHREQRTRVLLVLMERAAIQLADAPPASSNVISTNPPHPADDVVAEPSCSTVQIAPIPSDTGEVGVFRREGEHWRLELGGKACLAPNLVGMRYLHALVARPGENLTVSELLGDEDCALDGVTSDVFGDEQIDRKAREEYGTRLEQLSAERIAAVAAEDESRVAAMDEETNHIQAALGVARGRGSRMRRVGSRSEAQRSKVAHGIERALAKLEKLHQGMHTHFVEALVGWASFSPAYKPRLVVSWMLA